MDKLQKPFSITLRETEQVVIDVLNNSGLPIDVIDSMMSKIAQAVSVQANQAYQQELAAYNQKVSKTAIDDESVKEDINND